MKMSYLLLLTLTLSYVSFALTYGPEVNHRFIMDNFKSHPTKEQFKVFHLLYEKEYSLDSDEGLLRYRIFKENLKMIEKLNADAGEDNHGITQFADMTMEELEKKYSINPELLREELGYDTSSKKFLFDEMADEDEELFSREQTAPVDWTPFMNPVRNQQSMGICGIFAKNAAVEGQYRINYKENISLSVQYANDCSNYSENGTFILNGGMLLDSDYPFKNRNGYCPESDLEPKRLSIFTGWRRNTSRKLAEFRQMISVGPVVVGVSCKRGLFSWSPTRVGAIFNPPSDCAQNIDHGVLAVGIMMVNGVEVIKVRNSWGPTWGNEGYFFIPVANSCGMTSGGAMPLIRPMQPLPAKQKTFYPVCNSTTNPIVVNDGAASFPNFTTGAKSAISNPASTTDTWNYFSQPNCQGTPISINGDSRCFDRSRGPLSVLSAARMSYDDARFCIIYWENSCFTGRKIRICNSLSDLSTVNFSFKASGSFFFGGNIKSLVFYNGTKYTGTSFTLAQNSYYNISTNTQLLNAMTTAKSITLSRS